jgi:hypothetical protein
VCVTFALESDRCAQKNSNNVHNHIAVNKQCWDSTHAEFATAGFPAGALPITATVTPVMMAATATPNKAKSLQRRRHACVSDKDWEFVCVCVCVRARARARELAELCCPSPIFRKHTLRCNRMLQMRNCWLCPALVLPALTFVIWEFGDRREQAIFTRASFSSQRDEERVYCSTPDKVLM